MLVNARYPELTKYCLRKRPLITGFGSNTTLATYSSVTMCLIVIVFTIITVFIRISILPTFEIFLFLFYYNIL